MSLSASSARFLSTLSLRRATISIAAIFRRKYNFYPRSPCGERPVLLPSPDSFSTDFYPRSPCGERRPRDAPQALYKTISIHALLAESDLQTSMRRSTVTAFLSTLSLRRATRRSVKLFRQNYISIHALLAESDPPLKPSKHFLTQFLSTLSLRRATPEVGIPNTNTSKISIHALLAESDCGSQLRKSHHLYFYPRSPCGERHKPAQPAPAAVQFLSTLSLRRATAKNTSIAGRITISIHALLAESDEDQNCANSSGPLFLSTLSLRRATV